MIGLAILPFLTRTLVVLQSSRRSERDLANSEDTQILCFLASFVSSSIRSDGYYPCLSSASRLLL